MHSFFDLGAVSSKYEGNLYFFGLTRIQMTVAGANMSSALQIPFLTTALIPIFPSQSSRSHAH